MFQVLLGCVPKLKHHLLFILALLFMKKYGKQLKIETQENRAPLLTTNFPLSHDGWEDCMKVTFDVCTCL